jgi:Flp pilus assembly protein TadG
MTTHNPKHRRSGATTLENALVFPIVLFLFLALIVGGIGVFRYQQVACLAQEAARWACVRGCEYQKDADKDSPTGDEVLQQAVLPLAVGMDPGQISLRLEWVNQAAGTSQDWDSAPKDVKSRNAQGEYVTNTVRATVTYTWAPGMLMGPITMTSQCELPMSE